MPSSMTLSQLRDRVRTQLSAAGGFTEPLVVSAASDTLATLRDRVEARLQDATNARWSTGDLDEAIQTALERYTQYNPNHAIGTINVAAASREISISTLTGALRIEKVWWDYDSTTPGYPPNWRQFEVWPGAILYIDDEDEPQAGDVIRVWYTKAHTINGLDAAAATTIPAEDIGTLVTGAAHFAAIQRAIELSESLNIDRDVVKRLQDWAEDQGKAFRYEANLQPPAWERYAYAYDQDDIDEAIRWALHRYSEVAPNRKIGTITLAAAGREISVSTLTGYVEIERVWWDYDSAAPGHPPQWRGFELWPGSIVYINDPQEPAAGDVVRVWYTTTHTISGLDSATSTTTPADADTLLVAGAVGYAAQERIQEHPGRNVPRKLAEWGEARLREFERGLKLVARRQAARASGIAQGPALDRWDAGKW